MASAVNNFVLSQPYFTSNLETRVHSRNRIRCPASRDSAAALSSDSVKVVNGVSSTVDEGKRALVDLGNGYLKKEKDFLGVKLEPLWDDGYGTETVKDYLDYAKDIIKPDGGPARWFTPISCGPHLPDSPVLFFLPGMDGLGLGLILHHKPLGKVFDVRCMHIPVQDRTPFEDLVKWVEQSVRAEHSSSPKKPIYLVGDSFGGSLALAVAARNPNIDLVIILANPATSFGRSQLQPLLPLLEALPDQLHITVFVKDVEKDMVVLMAARASRMQNQDAIDCAIVSVLDDPKEARAGITEVHFLPFNPTDKRTALTYLDSDGKMHSESKGAPEQILNLAYNRADIAKKVHAIIDKFAERGLRSLAVARHDFLHDIGTVIRIQVLEES